MGLANNDYFTHFATRKSALRGRYTPGWCDIYFDLLPHSGALNPSEVTE